MSGPVGFIIVRGSVVGRYEIEDLGNCCPDVKNKKRECDK